MTQPIYTAFASQALELADVFRMFVGSAPVQGSDGRAFVAELSTPHGPSTGGGAQSLQHVTFTRDGRTFVVGSIDATKLEIELRGHESLSRQYLQRWAQPLPLSPTEYDAFVKRVRAFASSKQFVLVIKEIVAPFTAEVVPSAPPSKAGTWVAWLLVVLVSGGIAALVVLSS